MEKVCECRVCVRGRRFGRIVQTLSADDQAFMNDLYSDLAHAETDAAWSRRLIDDHNAAQRIEARSDETPQEVRPEGQEPDGEADAP